MTDDRSPSTPGGAIREAAATWFARMRGPDADALRPTFEAWLADSPVHREAYNRIGEVFVLGKGLSASGTATSPVSPSKARAPRAVVAACVATALVLAGAGGWVWTRQQAAGPPDRSLASPAQAPQAALLLSTPVGGIRTWRLADGTRVTLDTGSMLRVAYTPALRSIRLLGGRARFDVAHASRPFVVAAGAGTVTAHGTLFDVRLEGRGAVAVRLIRGAVDVDLPRSAEVPTPLRQRLAPGEQLVFDAAALPAPRVVAAPADARWPDAMLDCDHATLAAIVGEANRYSETPIVLKDPALGTLQLSGSFRIDDPEKLARRLGILFDLAVTHDDRGRLLLTQG